MKLGGLLEGGRSAPMFKHCCTFSSASTLRFVSSTRAGRCQMSNCKLAPATSRNRVDSQPSSVEGRINGSAQELLAAFFFFFVIS